jgi:hypothetical protein
MDGGQQLGSDVCFLDSGAEEEEEEERKKGGGGGGRRRRRRSILNTNSLYRPNWTTESKV